MDPDTMGDGSGDIYWRRRMSVLVAVLVVVAVVAWACSSGGSGPQRPSSTQSSVSVTPTAADPLLAGLHTMTVSTGTPSPTPSAGKTTTAALPPQRPGDPCSEGDLVLSMQGKQDVYAPGAQPNFLISLVNTGPVMCSADVGPRSMEVRITSGEDRIWSNSDCVSGEATELRQLQRGVPFVRSLDWDRRRSSSDCRTDPPAALPGTYVAVVHMGKLRSPMGVFHLR
ncbi:hypothetical protein [Nonomuraea sp. NPDC049141]|uniref:hypothetical protein n=1 Tax=unclassified Nonomuraea TaxID=2593643 RepID=UPI0033ED745E